MNLLSVVPCFFNKLAGRHKDTGNRVNLPVKLLLCCFHCSFELAILIDKVRGVPCFVVSSNSGTQGSIDVVAFFSLAYVHTVILSIYLLNKVFVEFLVNFLMVILSEWLAYLSKCLC